MRKASFKSASNSLPSIAAGGASAAAEGLGDGLMDSATTVGPCWSLAGRAVAESLADSAAALVFFAVGDAGGVPGIGSGGPHGTTWDHWALPSRSQVELFGGSSMRFGNGSACYGTGS